MKIVMWFFKSKFMNLKCFIPVDVMNFTEEKSFFEHENILYMKFVDTFSKQALKVI